MAARRPPGVDAVAARCRPHQRSPQALKDLWRLFVQHPLEFLLLFFVFSLLGTPAYLAYRRRTFVGVVAG